MGVRVVFHIIIGGGDHFLATVNSLREVMDTLDDSVLITIWANKHFGELEYQGLHLHDSPIFKECMPRIYDIIIMPTFDKDLYGKDFNKLMASGLLFREAISDSAFSLVSRQRLKMMQRCIFETLEESRIFNEE